MLAPYLLDLADLIDLVGLAVVLGLFLVIGASADPSAAPPEIRIVTGWGVAAVVLTFWGVMTPFSLRIPLAGLGVAAMAIIVVPSWRRRIGPFGGLGPMAVLTLPFWLVMLPAWPSQVDTWLNLLPNAAYLFDHDMLPKQGRPPSWSFLPVAPYNTQFAAYAVSVVVGHLVVNAMALFNLALLIAAGVLLARVLHDRPVAAPPWWAIACGFALAIPLNPGFVPRTFLSGYGETPLAVCALFAVWLGADALREMGEGRFPRAGVALALVLAALVNVKQSGIGLLAPIGVSFVVLAVTHPTIGWRRGLGAAAAILAPALALWLVWRAHALASFEVGELRPLSVSEWNVSLLPTILGAMARTIVQKVTFYVCLLAVLLASVRTWRRESRSADATRLALIAGTIALYNGFLLFTYVAHFPPAMAVNAHSYFRYSGHLSLLVMLGLVIWLRPLAAQAAALLGTRARLAGGFAIATVVILPVALAPMLRFDLQAPHPALFALGPRIATHLPTDARLALLVPGDPFDAAGSAVRGMLLYLEPRRPRLDVRTLNRADAGALEAVRRDGYAFALVTCTPADWPGVPPAMAALLRAVNDRWTLVEAWPWPPGLARERFGALLERRPFCADSAG
jgi:hypothetical protein